ncbi:MAG: LysM peptidoglycan-binding domain-containing protein [Acidobacteriota bacterium]
MVQPVGANPSSSNAIPAATLSVTVQAGQTLADIAAQNGTTSASLLRANPQLSDSTPLVAGQRLALPSPTTTARVDIADGSLGPGPQRSPRGGALPGSAANGGHQNTASPPPGAPTASPPTGPVSSTNPTGVTSGPVPNNGAPPSPTAPGGGTPSPPVGGNPGAPSTPLSPGEPGAPQARPSVGVTSPAVPSPGGSQGTGGGPNAPLAGGQPTARPSIGVTSGPLPAGTPTAGGPSANPTAGAPRAQPSVGVTSGPIPGGVGPNAPIAGGPPTAQPSIGVTSGPIPTAAGLPPGNPGAIKIDPPALPPGTWTPPPLASAPAATVALSGLRGEAAPGPQTPVPLLAPGSSGEAALRSPTAPPFQPPAKSVVTVPTSPGPAAPGNPPVSSQHVVPRAESGRPAGVTVGEGDVGLQRALDEGPVRQARQLAETDPRGLERLLQRTHGRFVDAAVLQRLIALARAGRWPTPARLAFVNSTLLQGAPVAYASHQGGTVLLNASLRNTPAGLTAALGEAAARHLDRSLGVPRVPLQPGRALLSGLAGAATAPRAPEIARSVVAWSGQVLDVEVASPAIGAWLTRAASSSRVEGFINYAIAALVGAPTGIWSQRDAPVPMLEALETQGAGDGLGRFREAMDDVIEVVAGLARQGVPGAARLQASLEGARDALLTALEVGDLRRARALFGGALGHLREGQVAAHLQARGARITYFGQPVEVTGGHQASEIDVAARLGEERLYATVLAGQRGARKVADAGWRKLVELTDEVLRFAAREGARLTFFVDVLSPDLQGFLTSRGIETQSNAGWVS